MKFLDLHLGGPEKIRIWENKDITQILLDTKHPMFQVRRILRTWGVVQN